MGLIKFLVSLLLLPVVFSVTQAFCWELEKMKEVYQLFACGILTYVITHLFLVNFQGLYQGGQKLLTDGLKFSPFLSSFVPLVLPLFPAVLMLTLYVAGKFFSMRQWEPYIVFFTGMTFAMHLILSAQIMRGEDNGIFKAHYFFVMSLGYICNILLMAALLDLNFEKFAFIDFLNKTAANGKDIYLYIYSRLAGT